MVNFKKKLVGYTQANKKNINYFTEILKFLYFNIEIGEEVLISDLSGEETRESFLAAVDFFIDKNLGVLGGFQIKYLDQSRESIKKVTHLFLDEPKGDKGENVVRSIDYFCKEKDESPKVVVEKYRKLLEYGDK